MVSLSSRVSAHLILSLSPSTKPPNASDNLTANIGKFESNATCFGDLTQLHTYYIFLVSSNTESLIAESFQFLMWNVF